MNCPEKHILLVALQSESLPIFGRRSVLQSPWAVRPQPTHKHYATADAGRKRLCVGKNASECSLVSTQGYLGRRTRMYKSYADIFHGSIVIALQALTASALTQWCLPANLYSCNCKGIQSIVLDLLWLHAYDLNQDKQQQCHIITTTDNQLYRGKHFTCNHWRIVAVSITLIV